VTLSTTSAAQTSTPSGTAQTSNSAPVSLQNSPSLSDVDDDDDDDDDGAATSLSDDPTDLVCDPLQTDGPRSTPQTHSDVEDHQPSVEQAKLSAAAAAADKGSGWANSRRRKSSRPQWHYEGTVLDRSQRPLAVNGTDDGSLTMWDDVDHGCDNEDPTTKDALTDSLDDDDGIRSDPAAALSNCVTSH